MRCCSLNWLKFILFESSIIQIGTGAFIIYVGVSCLSAPLVIAIDKEWVGAVLIVIGIFMLIFTAFAAYGTYYEKKWCLCSYMFVAFWSGSLLLTFGIACLWGRAYAGQYLGSDDNCYSLKALRKASDTVIRAGSIMCTIFCPCNLKPTTHVNLYANQTFIHGPATKIQNCDTCWNIEYYPATTQALLVAWMKKYLKIDVTPSNCVIPDDAFSDTYLGDYAKYLPLLKYVENTFSCSGICVMENVFLFTDINRGTPNGNCRQKVYEWVNWITLKFGVTNIVFGCIQIFGMIIAFMIRRKIKIQTGIECQSNVVDTENGISEKQGLDENVTYTYTQTDNDATNREITTKDIVNFE
ncbi:unnamed protein product [Blepharisma stoltei]|uniref:Tetraspanin n=1 Tax=Blepharisma stoltei TaxID=1481888 RepID=A0AAU9IW14_9CILI|nr:unnamed protein product [Blepharisma stoltei]